jgi:uncharacterized protein YbaP (TraB family)
MIRRFLLPALAAVALLPAAALARPAMWVVRDADSEIVLFGSVHVLPPGLDWRPPALTAALARADDVWFELPFDAATQARFGGLARDHGLLPPEQSLTPQLSRAGRVRLARVCKAFGVNPLEIDRMRPWLAEVRLTLAAVAREEAAAGEGVEERLAAEAPPRARREAFETPEQQIALFADAPQAEQIASLERTLRDIEDDPAAYRRMVAAWMAGDTKALQKEALDPMKREAPADYRRLLVDRNVRWVQTLSRRMAGSGRTVVVVGAAHLAGPDGVPARLRRLGFEVEGP